jgi:hypothetical protein
VGTHSAKGHSTRVEVGADAVQICAALADPGRLALFGAVLAAGADGHPVAVALGDRANRKHLQRLVGAGVVRRGGELLFAEPAAFREAVAAAEELSAEQNGAGSPQVSALFSRGRLVSMPAPGPLREQLLGHLVERFEFERQYAETEVNEALAEVGADHVALRRYLVESGLLGRDNYGLYWREVVAERVG